MNSIQGICTCVDPLRLESDGVFRAQAAALSGAAWTIRDLPVTFMNGPQAWQDEVVKNVAEWEKHANIRFVFTGDPNALIRVSFEAPLSPQGQFNSIIGNGAKLVSRSQPTVNLGFLPDTAEDEFQRLILHEFGHVLGLVHEHQSPAAGLHFKIPQVFEYFAQFGWDAQMVQANILNRYTNAQISNATAFDINSIMLYPFPAEIADPATPVNRVLSDLDKQLIATLYPGKSSTPVETKSFPGIPLTINAAAIPSFIVVPGARVMFQFWVSSAGTYTIETHGDQALTMLLYDFANPSKALAADYDGSGQGLNAKIILKLNPGVYGASVGHLLPDGTGPFSISVEESS